MEPLASANADITVVVTCFNYGAYLPEAVDSALEQEGGAPAVKVVDDGSTDPATRDALERLPDGVEVIRQPNAGLSAARNAGIRQSETPYVVVLDADDRLDPTALQLLRGPLDLTSEVGFTYGVVRFFGEWEGRFVLPAYDPYKLLYRHIIGATALMRRELFDDVGGFDPTFRAYEDWEFWVHALARGWRGQKVDAVTLHYRRHGRTMNAEGRAAYRTWYRQLRTKHPQLYAREGRRRLASESTLGPIGRMIYRWWWGLRPLPAGFERMLHALLWRPGSPIAS